MSDHNGVGRSVNVPNVTVITDSGPNPQPLEIRLNVGYFKTPSGIVKLVQLVSVNVEILKIRCSCHGQLHNLV